MRKLKDILPLSLQYEIIGSDDISIESICIDNRQATKDSLFAAIKGTQVDGHRFIPEAIKSGTTCIIHSAEIPENQAGITYIKTRDVSRFLGELIHNFYERPTDELIVIGATGTNGKTTITTLLFELFMLLGYECGLISTVEYRIKNEKYQSTHTTPDPISLHKLLKKMHDSGCTHVFMEVSSHSIHQQRIAGIQFDGGIFSNITHDHLDYHGTFDAYIKAKKAFFDGLPNSAFSLTNRDDKNGLIMLQNTKSTRYTYGLQGNSDFNAKIIEHDFSGMQLKLRDTDFWSPLVGEFNAYNLLAVYAAATLITEGNEPLEVSMSALGRVAGRFETIAGKEGRTAIVDYAHTPDALLNVIKTIQHILKGKAQLITVVGCGGNRDKTKRPEMGKIAAIKSSRAVFTSDNPRDEDPHEIIQEMMLGVPVEDQRKVLCITDRKEAIRTAIALSYPGDVILISGKGHETYQEINGIRHDFDDRKIAINELNPE